MKSTLTLSVYAIFVMIISNLVVCSYVKLESVTLVSCGKLLTLKNWRTLCWDCGEIGWAFWTVMMVLTCLLILFHSRCEVGFLSAFFILYIAIRRFFIQFEVCLYFKGLVWREFSGLSFGTVLGVIHQDQVTSVDDRNWTETLCHKWHLALLLCFRNALL